MRSTIINLAKLIAALLLPGFVVAIYLNHSRLPEPHFTQLSDVIAVVAAVALGVCILATMKLERAPKLVAIVLYIPIAIVGVFSFALSYVCGEFGACL